MNLCDSPYGERVVLYDGLYGQCVVILYCSQYGEHALLCDRLYGERVARHLDLDCSFVELIPKRYVNIPTEARLRYFIV